jgi:hypothetical protein
MLSIWYHLLGCVGFLPRLLWFLVVVGWLVVLAFFHGCFGFWLVVLAFFHGCFGFWLVLVVWLVGGGLCAEGF